jgi:hypothetical protein
MPTLTAIGLLLTSATQLRLGNLPIGPGETQNVSTTLIQPGSVFRLVHGTFGYGKMIGTYSLAG